MNRVFFLILLLSACATRAETSYQDEVEKKIESIMKKQTFEEIRVELAAVSKSLSEKIATIKPGESDKAWQEYMYLGTHKDFLELLKFEKKEDRIANCDLLRLKIVQGFSPRNDYPEKKMAPPAAISALKVLAHACQRPDLALFPKGPCPLR